MEGYRQYYKKCVVPGCEELFIKKHTFPVKDIDLFNNGLEKVQNPILNNKSPDQIYKSYRVCDKHFHENDKIPGTKRGLRKTAVPTLHLPCAVQSGDMHHQGSVSTSTVTSTDVPSHDDSRCEMISASSILATEMSSKLKSIFSSCENKGLQQIRI